MPHFLSPEEVQDEERKKVACVAFPELRSHHLAAHCITDGSWLRSRTATVSAPEGIAADREVVAWHATLRLAVWNVTIKFKQGVGCMQANVQIDEYYADPESSSDEESGESSN